MEMLPALTPSEEQCNPTPWSGLPSVTNVLYTFAAVLKEAEPVHICVFDQQHWTYTAPGANRFVLAWLGQGERR